MPARPCSGAQVLLAYMVQQEIEEDEMKRSLTGALKRLGRKVSTPFQSRTRVLLVDDSETVLTVMSKWLENKGCVVYSAENGREGLYALQIMQYDLVFVDFLMVRYARCSIVCSFVASL